MTPKKTILIESLCNCLDKLKNIYFKTLFETVDSIPQNKF